MNTTLDNMDTTALWEEVWLYCGVSFVWTWLWWGYLALLGIGLLKKEGQGPDMVVRCGGGPLLAAIGILQRHVLSPDMAMHFGGAGPLLAAVSCTWWRGGSVWELLSTTWDFQSVGWNWASFCVLFPTGIVFAACLAASTLSKPLGLRPPLAKPLSVHFRFVGWVGVTVVCIMMIPLEEVGWRGYLMPRVMALAGGNVPVTALVLGVVWALWHLPIFLWEDYALSVQQLGRVERELHEKIHGKEATADTKQEKKKKKKQLQQGKKQQQQEGGRADRHRFQDASFLEGTAIFLFYCLGLSAVSWMMGVVSTEVGSVIFSGVLIHGVLNASVFACGVERLNSLFLFLFLTTVPFAVHQAFQNPAAFALPSFW